MLVLVTGGAGYVGAHTVRVLLRAGYEVVVLDSFEHGHRAALPDGQLVDVVEGRVGNAALLHWLFRRYRVDAVLHFAGYIEAPRSVREPEVFYRNNVGEGMALLQAMLDAGVRHLIFSSTAAVYGDPVEVPIREDHPLQPVNPYGWSKLFFERMLADLRTAHGLQSVSLRYFNAAGADPGGEIGEAHPNETHLIPRVLAVALGKADRFTVYGTDYPTTDGTCERDYVHVVDLARAHLLALEALLRGSARPAYNVGVGARHSVRQVVQVCREVTGHPIPVQELDRRPGDPARLEADATLIQRDLGWRPELSDLRTIVASAWAWHRAHPDGYR
ncbi:MAG TPA: UDP-glucose 4-epimerase GalE [Chloroflexota bacterium]